MKKVFFAIALSIVGIAAVAQNKYLSYTVPDQSWSEQYGNHRAVLEVTQPAKAIRVNFLWRRNDQNPELRRMMIINAATGEEIKNVYRLHISNERCELVFGPVVKTGIYHLYYLPYTPETVQYVAGSYLSPEPLPDRDWLKKTVWQKDSTQLRVINTIDVKEIQARSLFDSFYPMEVAATATEFDSLVSRHQQKSFLVFPEDRTRPIRMKEDIPIHWLQYQSNVSFTGKAQRNEYYALQLGVVATQKDIADVRVAFTDLKNATGDIIPAAALTCFNTDGVDTKGQRFVKRVDVNKRAVQPLWIGIDIAGDAVPGVYRGNATVTTANAGNQPVAVEITIENTLLADRGDGETWRHSRLRWLNSTLGIDDHPTLAYQSMMLDGGTITATNKEVVIASSGLPSSVKAGAVNILYSPIRFTVEMENRIVQLEAYQLQFKERKSGVVTWSSQASNDILTITCNGSMEFDGRMKYQYTVTSKTAIHIQDIRLEIPLKKEFATYMVGMGRMGGRTPANHISRWQKTEDSFWIGTAEGGIQCELRGSAYHGPLLNLYQPSPPASWYNGVNGGFRIDSDRQAVTAAAYSGARKMMKGQKISFEFDFQITPVKEMNWHDHFSWRYVHNSGTVVPSVEAIANHGNVINVHHANRYNPYINYPFIAQKEMKDLVTTWHEKGWKVKIYYTVRELTNHLTEIWALRSLGDEILSGGKGGGYQWLQEHLVTDYTPQWYTHLGDGVVDAAILNGSESRWYNYYVEGLHWLMKNMDIDGLYLDDVSFDRHILKRIRKVMELSKKDAMIDLHSNTAFSLGSANQNLEMFPFIDRTWFGEGFNFDLMPADFWFTEVSGIPFGIGNDILMHMSVNNKRGMVYGMTHRDFPPMWKLWDDFSIKDARVVGYWDTKPIVLTGNDNVFATAYINKNKTLIALGNWSNQKQSVQLSLDWKTMGIRAGKATMTIPGIKGYQEYKVLKDGELINLDAKSDCLIIVHEQ
ncbi:MAG: glycoside hydrolase domain-containing protein [Agriterribacter sp.]